MANKTQSPTCWVVSEGMAGTENQCLGVTDALGITPEIKRIALRQPWAALSPWLPLECGRTFHPPLEGPWPDLLIASGRKSIAASRYIKRMSGGKTFTVQIQDPRISPAHFDLVAVPAHDPARGDNVIVTTAAPNRITPARIDAARQDFSAFSQRPSPRVALLIGGNSKAHRLTRAVMERLAAQLKRLKAGLMVTTSRRTGAENESILRAALAGSDAFIWDGSGDNPYHAMLAWADVIIVTGDSVSMLSEAASTGKPVYMIPLEGGGRRLDQFHTNLKLRGAARDFTGSLAHWTYAPLDDAKLVADAIKQRMAHA